MKEKKKNTVKIVDRFSVNYTFTDNKTTYNQSIDKKKINQVKTQKIVKRSIKDIKNENRYKINSKNIKSLQGHSPVYE